MKVLHRWPNIARYHIYAVSCCALGLYHLGLGLLSWAGATLLGWGYSLGLGLLSWAGATLLGWGYSLGLLSWATLLGYSLGLGLISWATLLGWGYSLGLLSWAGATLLGWGYSLGLRLLSWATLLGWGYSLSPEATLLSWLYGLSLLSVPQIAYNYYVYKHFNNDDDNVVLTWYCMLQLMIIMTVWFYVCLKIMEWQLCRHLSFVYIISLIFVYLCRFYSASR